MAIWTRLNKWFNALAGEDRSVKIAHAGKWTFYFVLIGIIAGLGSIVFHWVSFGFI